MKTRNGFVSNSSSSSYIVLLPKNFQLNLEAPKTKSKIEEYYETSPQKVTEAFRNLTRDGDFWKQSGWAEFEVLIQALDNYIIAQVEHGPDEGQIILVSKRMKERVASILKE